MSFPRRRESIAIAVWIPASAGMTSEKRFIMINIIFQRLKEQYRSVLIYTAALIAYALLMISIFPTIQKMDLKALMASYPKELAKFFSSSGIETYSTIEGYMAMEYLSMFFVIIIVFYIGSAAGSAIAGTIEKRTMDFNLSQPVSRSKLVLAEAAVAVKYSALIVSLVSLSMFIFGQIFNTPFHAKGLVAFTVVAILFLWALYGIAIFLSSILRTKLSVVLLIFGFVMASFVFSSLTRIVEKIQHLDKISIFYLYSPEQLLKTGTVNWNQAGILFLIFVLGLSAAIVIFNRKDI